MTSAATDNRKLTGSDGGHGRGFPLPEFTHLLPLRTAPQFTDVGALTVLARQMVSRPDKISDGPDPEENLFLPAGYTYLGQFIDHDLTLDTTSTLDIDNDLKDPSKPANDPSNLRSPRFDLDCVYGNGPDDQPYLYVQADADSPAGALFKNASMVLDGHDLARGSNGRALIGDKRNDENSIVNQIQQAFIKFHNQVVRTLVNNGATERGGALFKRARDEVRWAYQTIITDDFLPRLIEHGTLNAFLDERASQPDRSQGYRLYTKEKRANLPREFVVAAYRYGHSMVRTGYRLNGDAARGDKGTRLPIFTPSDKTDLSLIGFDPLPLSHVIDDWGRFFPIDHPRPGSRLTLNDGDTAEDPDANPAVRLQYAYKIDPSLADPLGLLPPKIAQPGDVPGGKEPPSLSLLNLLRGNRYLIQGGQQFEGLVGSKLDSQYLVTRQRSADDTYSFEPIPAALRQDTPLWFYVLAEAQRHLVDLWLDKGGRDNPNFVLTKDHLLGKVADPDPEHPEVPLARGVSSQLGPVGGRIVAEVFYGLLDEDNTSVVNRPAGIPWQPIWGAGPHTFARLLDFTRLKITDGLA